MALPSALYTIRDVDDFQDPTTPRILKRGRHGQSLQTTRLADSRYVDSPQGAGIIRVELEARFTNKIFRHRYYTKVV